MIQPPIPYGQLVTIQVTNPGAGAQWNFSVPGKSHIRILSVEFNILASAVAANRLAELVANDTAQNFAVASPGTLQTAAQNVAYHYAVGLQLTTSNPGGVAIQVFAPLQADLILRGQGGTSDILSSNVINMDPGDQITNIFIRYEQWTQADLT